MGKHMLVETGYVRLESTGNKQLPGYRITNESGHKRLVMDTTIVENIVSTERKVAQIKGTISGFVTATLASAVTYWVLDSLKNRGKKNTTAEEQQQTTQGE